MLNGSWSFSEGLKPKIVFLLIKPSRLTTMYFLLDTKEPKGFISYTCFPRACFHGKGQIVEGTNFLPVKPVYTEPCKFCYKLRYGLPFKNLFGRSRRLSREKEM